MSKGEKNDVPSDELIIESNQALLDAIASGDYAKYKRLVPEDVTAFEPESCGALVSGLGFHKFNFDQHSEIPGSIRRNIMMSNPHVRKLGQGAAVVSYTRIDQIMEDGRPFSKTWSETRVWEMRGNRLMNVHFHKS